MVCCSCSLFFYVSILAALAAAFKIYMKLTTGWARSKTCLVGKTAIVTGANTGLGYHTALDFAMRGAKVILACRDRSRAEEAREKIIRESGNEKVFVKILDLASFQSVRDFAKDVNKTEERLDILVNNAGLAGFDERTEDGHLVVMQVNHLSGFLLTHLLIDLLKKSGPSRIINVSSVGARFGRRFDVDKLDVYPRFGSLYPHTKLCNILFTRELAQRLKGTGVTTYSLHPGAVNTDFFRNLNKYLKYVLKRTFGTLFKNAEEGAQTNIYTAVEPGIEMFSGEHFHDCKKVEPYRTVVLGQEKKLWEKSQELIKMKPEEIRI